MSENHQKPIFSAPSFNEKRLKDASEMPLDALFSTYETSASGLSGEEAVEAHRDAYGKNIIVKAKHRNAILRFFLSFANPFTLVLLILAAVSFLTDVILADDGSKDPTAAIIIVVLVLLSGAER
jgi:Mg2+-importing ATPase